MSRVNKPILPLLPIFTSSWEKDVKNDARVTFNEVSSSTRGVLDHIFQDSEKGFQKATPAMSYRQCQDILRLAKEIAHEVDGVFYEHEYGVENTGSQIDDIDLLMQVKTLSQNLPEGFKNKIQKEITQILYNKLRAENCALDYYTKKSKPSPYIDFYQRYLLTVSFIKENAFDFKRDISNLLVRDVVLDFNTMIDGAKDSKEPQRFVWNYFDEMAELISIPKEDRLIPVIKERLKFVQKKINDPDTEGIYDWEEEQQQIEVVLDPDKASDNQLQIKHEINREWILSRDTDSSFAAEMYLRDLEYYSVDDIRVSDLDLFIKVTLKQAQKFLDKDMEKYDFVASHPESDVLAGFSMLLSFLDSETGHVILDKIKQRLKERSELNVAVMVSNKAPLTGLKNSMLPFQTWVRQYDPEFVLLSIDDQKKILDYVPVCVQDQKDILKEQGKGNDALIEFKVDAINTLSIVSSLFCEQPNELQDVLNDLATVGLAQEFFVSHGESDMESVQRVVAMGQKYIELLQSYKGMVQKGYNLVYGPVCDNLRSDGSGYMEKARRAFSHDPGVTALLARLTIQAAEHNQDSNLGFVIKHAPGIGNVVQNPEYEGLQIDRRGAEEIMSDLNVFVQVARQTESPVGIMISGVAYPELEQSAEDIIPAALSSSVCSLMRDKAGEDAVLFSDDLCTSTFQDWVGYNWPDVPAGSKRVTKTLCLSANAGIDMMLVYYRGSEMYRSLLDDLVLATERGEVSRETLEASVTRILEYKKKQNPDSDYFDDITAKVKAMSVRELWAQKMIVPSYKITDSINYFNEGIGGITFEGVKYPELYISRLAQEAEARTSKPPLFLCNNSPQELTNRESSANSLVKAEVDCLRLIASELEKQYPEGVPQDVIDEIYAGIMGKNKLVVN